MTQATASLPYLSLGCWKQAAEHCLRPTTEWVGDETPRSIEIATTGDLTPLEAFSCPRLSLRLAMALPLLLGCAATPADLPWCYREESRRTLGLWVTRFKLKAWGKTELNLGIDCHRQERRWGLLYLNSDSGQGGPCSDTLQTKTNNEEPKRHLSVTCIELLWLRM